MNIYPLTPEYEIFLRDESRASGFADSVSFPENEAETAEIMRTMYERGIPVTIQGGRTGVSSGAVPHGGHIMNLSRMSGITGIRKADGKYYVCVQPGMVLSALRKVIENRSIDPDRLPESDREAALSFINDREYFFPTDPTETSALIGGIASCNASGARSFMFGAAKNHITRLRMVSADGRTADIRRGCVFADGRKLQFPFTDGSSVSVTLPSYELPRCKNASGYYAADDMDAIDLIIGSDGTLGAITLVELELLPLPEHIWGASCFFASEEQAIAFTQRIRGCFANLAAVEYFDPDALDLLRAQKRNSSAFSSLPDIPADAACCIYAEIREEDRKRAFDSLMALGGCISACGGDEAHTWVARTGLDMERLQFFRHAVPESVNMTIDERRKRDPGITKLAGDMSVPDEYLADVMKMYRESLREYGLQSAVFGHIGNNHLHVNILPADGDDYRRGKELLKKWAARVTEMGGAVSAEHGIGKLKTDFLRIMYGEEHIREMAAVKRAFDPKMILGRDNLFPAALFERAETEGL